MFDLSLEVLRVVEDAAIASARTMGMGDPRRERPCRGGIDAPLARYASLSMASSSSARESAIKRRCSISARRWAREPRPIAWRITVDIAVDPLEGTNLCSTGGAGAITVLAASERGGLLHAPDCYMEKIVVGPAAKGAVELDAPVKQNSESHRPPPTARR